MFSNKATVEILENYVSDAAFQHIIINIVSIVQARLHHEADEAACFIGRVGSASFGHAFFFTIVNV
jgi:hypothetical protein